MRIHVLLGMLLLCAHHAAAQATEQPTRLVGGIERREMIATQMDADDAIRLDGVLDESIWQDAVPASDFRQQDPENGAPATEPTEVRIAYSRDALYMGVTCYDSEPDKWLGFQRGRDGFLGSDDRFMWTIDTFLDGRTAYFFEMNPSGLMADALQGSADVSNRQWDGIWNARVNRSDIGWTIEIEIPFRTLNFHPSSDTWGINFQRTVRRKNEETLWMGWVRNQGLRRMTNAGLVTGISPGEVTQGHGLDIKPYVVGETSRAWRTTGASGTTTEHNADVGVDLFYNPTPSLRANVTVNTDFAQAEVDQRQTNLTRFSLFFPEKRDFFLDGSLFFNFADGGNSGGGGGGPPVDVAPFFSRRIGLDERGTPQSINFGSKLTGQAGAFDIGVLHVQTREEALTPGEDFSVLRVKRRFLQQSYVGGIYTRRAARGFGPADRHTTGVDFELATSTFLRRQNLIANGFLVKSPAVGASSDDLAVGLQLEYPNDPLEAQLEYREVQRNYDAAVGFTRRINFRQYNPRLYYSPRPSGHRWIRRFNFGLGADVFVDPHTNDALDNEIDITAFEVDLHSQDSLEVHVVPTYERLVENFRISPAITLPVGNEYNFTRYRVQLNTAGRRLLSVRPEVEWGDFYSGDRMRLSMTSNVRLMPGLMFTLAAEWNEVQLAEGRFSTRLYRGVSEFQFTPFMAWVNNVQFDTQSAVLGWQSRYRWILQPGNEIYFVYNHNWLDDPLRSNRFRSLDNRLSSKLLYTYRF
ncbi:MAG TPA: carbohydrate binding family 9 domain-containing protein [Vicinamibacterales bacterium]|jgi:Domain of unknown function (DUF5916)|nr:carbohydrate binding family 9 domain-containing protein [Vicinamibacterales bacterium]